MTINDGFYDGTVAGFSIDVDNQDADGMVLTFDVNLDAPGGISAIRCRHWTHGRNADKTEAMVKAQGFEWPGGIAKMDEMVGREIRVQAVTYDGKQRFYVTKSGGGRSVQADSGEVERRLAKLTGAPEQTIF